jgi:hypothetical protein
MVTQDHNNMIHPDDMLQMDTASLIPVFFYEFANNPNVLTVYAGPVAGASGKQIVGLNAARTGHLLSQKVTPTTVLCFDNIYEGNCGPVIDKIYEIIQNTNIKPSQCNYFSAGLDSHELHNQYCERKGITDKINIYSCNTWESSLLMNSQLKDINYTLKLREKTFLCFNRIFRSHRVAMLGLLYSMDLVKNSFYSFFSDSTYTDKPAPENDLFKQIRRAVDITVANTAINGYMANRDKLPLTLNISWQNNANYIRVEDIKLFQDSYFSLVTETFFFGVTHPGQEHDEDAIFFTEKTYKPILMKHPFIIAGRPHMLKYLRQLGYRTFSPFIDESYDSIEDSGDRLMAIVAEVNRLNNFTDDEWMSWQRNVQNIVEHNHSVIVNRKHYQYAFRRPSFNTQY